MLPTIDEAAQHRKRNLGGNRCETTYDLVTQSKAAR